jgi:uncharacterized membrane protein
MLQQVGPPGDESVPIDSTCELVETSQESLPQTPWIWKCLGVLSTTTAGFWVLFYVVLPYLVLGVVGDRKYWWSASGLPDLGATPTKALCMALHFSCGSVITLSGMWQLWPRSRTAKWIWLHRAVGRIYVVSAVLTFIGGFGFIAQQRVLAGGLNMTVSFSIYGFLVPSFALMAFWKVRNKDIEAHRRWAIRAFSMGIASWLYRVLEDMGALTGIDTCGSVSDPTDDRVVPFFLKPWEQFIQWAFWVIPVLFVEWYLRAPWTKLKRTLVNCLAWAATAVVFIFLVSKFIELFE